MDLITFYIARSLYIARLRRYRKAAMRLAANGDLLVPGRLSAWTGSGRETGDIDHTSGEDTVTQCSRFMSTEAAYSGRF